MLQLGIVIIIVLLCYILVRSVIRARHDPSQEWPALIASLEPVDTHALGALAKRHANDSDDVPFAGEALCKRPEDVIRLMANAEKVLWLAAYARRWSPEQSDAAVHALRGSFATIILLGFWSRLLASLCHSPPPQKYTFLMARAYTGMLKRIEDLYRTVHMGRYPALRAALHAGSRI